MTYPEYKDLVEYYVNNGFVFEKIPKTRYYLL